jgi:hypothetical protein
LELKFSLDRLGYHFGVGKKEVKQIIESIPSSILAIKKEDKLIECTKSEYHSLVAGTTSISFSNSKSLFLFNKDKAIAHACNKYTLLKAMDQITVEDFEPKFIIKKQLKLTESVQDRFESFIDATKKH